MQQGLRALFALADGARVFSLLFVLMLSLVLSGCERAPAVHHLGGATMGTTWSVKVVGLPAGSGLADVQQDLQLILESINHQMSTYQADSEISQFNQSEAGTSVALSPDFAQVLQYALRLAQETSGAYDPTVGPLVNLWGFGPDKTLLKRPSADTVAQAQQRTGWQRIRLETGVDGAASVVFQPGGAYLDLSSVAKGYAVDKLASYLNARQLNDYLVEIGGELRASGHKPDGTAWRVAVERPIPGVREVEKVLSLNNLSVATSGDYRNFFEEAGETYAHIIDPRTGYPVSHLTASVTVLAPTCAEADALATALTVLGPEDGLAFAQQRQLAVLFIVRTTEGFAERASPAFEQLRRAQQEH
ncbi:MAG: FAD:protein FMN transferase [Gammaproteobacteria bacterium]|nr:FAD:protein FMN transferase [Gammaproteobacteria bacterium]MBQ0773707.1 FAD:protein FMN transferase [Gammaproteobacteria bacterium]